MAVKKLNVKIAFVDGTVDEQVTVRPSLIVWFEKAHNTTLSALSEHYDQICLLAYEAWRRKHPKDVHPDFETWLDGIEALEMENINASPFVEDQSNGSVPTSPSSVVSPTAG